MKKTESRVVEEFGKFVQAFWVELPMAAANRAWGNGDESTFRRAGWKAYDAFVSLANETTNSMYADPLVGSLTGQTMEWTLQVRRMGSATASAFFGNLWPTVGLPTAGEVASLRREIATLHEELKSAVQAAQEEPLEGSTFTAPSEGLSLIRIRNKRKKHKDDQDAAA